MNKKRAKFNFILTSILLVLAIVLCFAQFNLPGSNDRFNGLFNSISATSEITQGNSAVYKIISDDVTDEDVEKTVDQIRSILDKQGYVGSKVYRQGSYIRAEVESKSNAANVLQIIGTSATFVISAKNEDEFKEQGITSEDIVGVDIRNAYSITNVQLNNETNGVTIEFTAEGARKYATMSKNVGVTTDQKVYFYIDGEKSIEISGIEATTNDFLSFTSPNYTKDMAQNYALQILMATTGVELKTISNSTTTATLGSSVLLYSMIAIAAILLAVMIVLPIVYGDLGLLADLSILIAGVFAIFILQALPLTTASVATIYGVLAGIVIMVVCHVIYFNKIKSEFTYLNRLTLAAKTGFKKSWLTNLDICALAFIGSISLSLWNIPYVSTFAIGLAVMSFIALFNTVVILKDFVTWYVTINPKNYKRVRFVKGENND